MTKNALKKYSTPYYLSIGCERIEISNYQL